MLNCVSYMVALINAALAGVGVVQLPVLMVHGQLATGSLVRLVPEWAPRREIIHAVFPSRRGLLPSVRALIDYLADRYSAFDEELLKRHGKITVPSTRFFDEKGYPNTS